MSDEPPDTQALDDRVTTSKWDATLRIRDWLHTREGDAYSSCRMWADTCSDWDLAYTLAEIALELPRKQRTIPTPNGPCYQCQTGGTRRRRWWSRRRRKEMELRVAQLEAQLLRTRWLLFRVALAVTDPDRDHVDRCVDVLGIVGSAEDWR